MRIAVIGGKLQGLEALYLAKKAGFTTVLIDKNPDAIAAGLCDNFVHFRFSLAQPIPLEYPTVDIILPAIEDIEVLECLKIWSDTAGIPLAFGQEAYSISQSKLRSDQLFHQLHLPAPRYWPDCEFPVVVKPDGESGSRGVEVFHDSDSLKRYLAANGDKHTLVIQEYLSGPSFSIEVIGTPGHYRSLQVTELHMDEAHDCKRVTAPANLSRRQKENFAEMALTLAQATELQGIMDLEVILHDTTLYLLEIDARLPSQTPMAVFWSTGINMVELLAVEFSGQESPRYAPLAERHVSIEHILVHGGSLAVLGEHIMSTDGAPSVQHNFFGATEALTTYSPGKSTWVATLIFVGDSVREIEVSRNRCHTAILNRQSS